jgi:hypothetical protein
VVLSAHDHDYERFVPQDPDGWADPIQGIRQFVVGTGGKNLHRFRTVEANSEVRNADSFGVLLLALHPGSSTGGPVGAWGRVRRCGVGVMPQAGPAPAAWSLGEDVSNHDLTGSLRLIFMETPSRHATQRRILAFVLVVLAIGLVVVKAIPGGVVLVTLTATHGLHVGDLPVLALLLAAGWLAVW